MSFLSLATVARVGAALLGSGLGTAALAPVVPADIRLWRYGPGLRKEIEEQRMEIAALKMTIKEIKTQNTKGQSSLTQYEMSRRPRGLCLIINNKNFHDAEANRKGSEIDERNLEKLFQELSFKVYVKNDLTWDQMRRVATEFAKKDHNEFDAFVFVIMSHGGNKDVIEGVDGRNIQIEDLMCEFTSANCPTLANKPKLFIIQTCRGERRSTVPAVMGDAVSDAAFSHDSTLSNSVSPPEVDFLLAFSTAPGYVAYRNEKYGSPFVRVLVEAIRKLHNNHHLFDILTEVTRLVVKEEKGVQVPAPTTTLRGQVWL